MHFRIASKLLDLFPNYCVGIVVVRCVDNAGNSGAMLQNLRRVEDEARKRFAIHPMHDDPSVVIWHNAFRAAGLKPTRYKTSVEALLARVLKGTDLPSVNPLVDTVNAASLRYTLPVGVHDLDKIIGDIVVGPAPEGSTFTPFGKSLPEQVDAGEIVFADEAEVRTRRWVWRQSESSKVTEQSRTVLIAIDGWLGSTDVSVRASQGELVKLLESELGAETRSFFLSIERPEALILADGTLPDQVIASADGFRMSGTGYIERTPGKRTASGSADSDLPVEASDVGAIQGRKWADEDEIGMLLRRATAEVIVRAELEGRLRRGDKLRVKFGVDPTSPNLHLGHAVVLKKLRAFQELGHTICLIIGDFTAQIGDASDKSSMRQMLTEQQVYENLATYKKQISRILHESEVEWSFNADWLGPLRFKDIVGLASHFTVAQMLERENFTNRFTGGQPIGLHEFMYPLMQGYDSVALKADVELGGTEQLFNLMAGRTLQRAFDQEPQAVMTCGLLLGLDGRKMSKSLGNAISLDDTPKDMFGKVMAFPDQQILPCFEMCTSVSGAELDMVMEELDSGTNPIFVKKRLAFEITRSLYTEAKALAAQEAFEREVQRKERPDVIPDCVLGHAGPWSMPDLLVEVGLTRSKSEARQKLRERAVFFDGERVEDPLVILTLKSGMVVKLGRHYRRVVLPD